MWADAPAGCSPERHFRNGVSIGLRVKSQTRTSARVLSGVRLAWTNPVMGVAVYLAEVALRTWAGSNETLWFVGCAANHQKCQQHKLEIRNVTYWVSELVPLPPEVKSLRLVLKNG